MIHSKFTLWSYLYYNISLIHALCQQFFLRPTPTYQVALTLTSTEGAPSHSQVTPDIDEVHSRLMLEYGEHFEIPEILHQEFCILVHSRNSITQPHSISSDQLVDLQSCYLQDETIFSLETTSWIASTTLDISCLICREMTRLFMPTEFVLFFVSIQFCSFCCLYPLLFYFRNILYIIILTVSTLSL